jgi:hypothetical protein
MSADDLPVPSIPRVDPRWRLLFCVVVTVAVLLIAAACGGGGGKAAATATTTTAKPDCLEQLITLANSDTVKKAMDAGDTPASLEGQFSEFTTSCGDALASLTPEDTTALLAKIDPAVAMWLAQGLG